MNSSVTPKDASEIGTLEEFIAKELHQPNFVLRTRYTDRDPQPLSMPFEKLKTYCESKGGTLEPVPNRDRVTLNVSGAGGWFGKFLCREGDIKRWAVIISPVGGPRYDGKTQNLLTFSVSSVYQQAIKVEPTSTALIPLSYCANQTARAVLNEAEDFYRNKLKVVPQLIDKSGFRKPEDVYRLVDISSDMIAECPTSMDQVLFRVALKGKPNDRMVFGIEPREYPKVTYQKDGVTLTPQVIIRSYTFGSLHPTKRFRDKHVEAEIESISSVQMRYTIRNLSDNYVDVQAVSIYFDKDISTTPVLLNVPPHATTATLLAAVPNSAKNALPVTLTFDDAKKRGAHIGLSVKYRVADRTESLYGEQRFAYAELLRD